MDVDIFEKGFSAALDRVLDACDSTRFEKNCLVSATSAHGLVYSRGDKAFAEVLGQFHTNLPDGVPLVWIGKLKGASDIERCYGPDFFRKVIMGTADKEINHFLCGGEHGVADNLKHICDTKFGNRHVVGTFSPPFREMTENEVAEIAGEIDSKGVDIVWIGMSTPKQEIFAHRLAKHINVRFICTVGAAFDFHTGRVREAPAAMQRVGLEWLFRLIMEPRRLLRRYLRTVPLFAIYAVSDLAGFYFRRTGRRFKLLFGNPSEDEEVARRDERTR